MTIEKHRNPILFYGLSTAIPWSFWFAAAYLSRIGTASRFAGTAVGILGVVGLRDRQRSRFV
jgi:hypothetical protein